MELAFYFPFVTFIESKDAVRNRLIYIEAVKRMEPAFTKFQEHY